MMRHLVGWETTTGNINQTERTEAKIEENTALILKDIKRAVLDLSSVEIILREALRWTADDVLKQAMADGYAPKEYGKW
jgi:Arc/MetJ family transcription regulator